jgi:hypothetical protein
MLYSQGKISKGGKKYEETNAFESYNGHTGKIYSNKPEPDRAIR